MDKEEIRSGAPATFRGAITKSLQWLVGLAVSLTALAVAVRGVRLAEMAAALQQTNFVYVALAVGFNLLGLYARALSWYIILGRKVPYARAFSALNEGYLLNNVLPLRLGEVGRAYLVSRGRPLGTSQALSSVMVERLIDLCMIMGLLGVFLPLVAGLSWARQAALVWVLVTLLALVGLFVVARSRELVLRLFRWGAARVPRHASRLLRWEPRLGAFVDGMGALRDGRRFLGAALCSGMAWLWAGIGNSMLLMSLPIRLDSSVFVVGFFALVVCGLGAALPSAPASAGIFELSVVAALSVFQVESSLAMTYALAYHLVLFGLTSGLGAVALAREGESLAHLARAAQEFLGGKKSPAGISVE
jgi:glycosyltransferase 2 family protein